jgi:amino acid transporter
LEKVFLREATGLVREIGMFNVMVTAVINMSVGMSILWLLGEGPVLAPGGDLIVGTLICFVLMIFGVLTWAFLGILMPRSGGDYVYLSRALHPAIAIGTSSVWWFVNVLTAAFGAAYVSSIGIPTLAYSINRPDIAAMSSTPLMMILVGSIVLILEASLLIVSLKAYLLFQAANFIVGMIMVIAVLAVMANTSPAQFAAAFNAFSAQYKSPDFNTVLSMGPTLGYSWTPNFSATLAVIPAAYWGLGYPYFASFFSGEIKGTRRNLLWGMIAGLALEAIVMVIAAAIFLNVVGYNFLGSVAAAWGAGKLSIPNAPYFQILAGMVVANNPALLVLFGVGMICWNLMWPGGSLWGQSRQMLAWSFDRVWPSWFGEVHTRFHTPYRSLFFTVVLAEIVLVIYAYYYSLLTFFTSEVMQTATTFMLIGVAAVLFPFMKKTRKLYESSAVSKYKVGPVPLLSISGALYMVILLTVLYYFTGPVYGELQFTALALTISVFVVAVVSWVIIRAYRKKQGINMDLAYKELPPE